MRASRILGSVCVDTGRRARRILLWALVMSLSPSLVSPRHILAQGAALEGFHEVANCDVISGWAWDANKPNAVIEVDIFADDVFIGSVIADIFRQDLLNAGKGDGNHGFSFPTPDILKDGLPHSVRVRFANSSVSLANSPKTVNCAVFLFDGFHDTADCSTITGWAWDANRPNTPINVDVYFDDEPFRSIQAPADKFRQDLLDAGIGNGFHAFSFPTPALLKDGKPHSLTIKFTGTNTNLNRTPRTITCGPPPEPFFEGFHEATDCNVITGWAWDALQPNTPINVDIYNGGTLIATISANQFRQDLLDAGKGNGFHAFSFFVPNSLKDGQPHNISVGFSGTFTGLTGTPKTINCPPPGGPVLQGFHEVANCSTISGWAWDSTQPNTPINVDIFSDNVLVMTVAANQFRQDLLNSGVGNGNHAFSFTVPASLKDGMPHSIEVRFGGTSTVLNGSPKSITCPP